VTTVQTPTICRCGPLRREGLLSSGLPMKQHRSPSVTPPEVSTEQDAPAAVDLESSIGPASGPGAGMAAAAPPPDAVPVDSVLAAAARSLGYSVDVQIELCSPVAERAGSA